MIKFLNCPHDENYSYAEILDSSGRSNSFAKLAGEFPKEVQDAVDQIKPKKDRITVVIAPMGYGEVWGPNVNGDFFPTQALEHPGEDYGYQTFMQANMFPHHKNKDPKKGFGKIPASFLDKGMHRIVVISEINVPEARVNGGEEFLKMLYNGLLPEVSMGCRVPYDVCSICGNKAKHPMYYCQHLKRGNMLRMDPESGAVAYAINTMPKFFDLSFVHRGADRSSGTLAKIASENNPSKVNFYLPSSYRAEYYEEIEKKAQDNVDIFLDEVVKVASDVMSENENDLFPFLRENPEVMDRDLSIPRKYLSKLASEKWGDICGSFWAKGIPLKESEIQYISLVKEGYSKLGDALFDQNLLLPHCDGYQELPDETIGVSKTACDVAEMVFEHKTINQPFFLNRLDRQNSAKLASEISNFDAAKIALGTTAAYALISKLVRQTDMPVFSKILKNNPKLLAALSAGSFFGSKMISSVRLENIASHHASPYSMKTAASPYKGIIKDVAMAAVENIKDGVGNINANEIGEAAKSTVDNIKDGVKSLVTKTIGDSGDVLVTSLITAAFLGNMQGAFDKRDKFLTGQGGDKVSGLDKVLTNHPYLSTAAFMTGANLGIRKLRGKLGNPIKKIASENLVNIKVSEVFPEEEKNNIDYINNFTLLMLNGG